MLPLLVMGGAAVLELRKRTKKPSQDVIKHLKESEKSLRQHVETVSKELENERQHAREVGVLAEELAKAKEELLHRNQSMEGTVNDLKITIETLAETNTELLTKKQELEVKTAQQEEEVVKLNSQVGALNAEVNILMEHNRKVVHEKQTVALERDQLSNDNKTLRLQVQEIAQCRQEEAEQHLAELEHLKQSVTRIFDKLMADSINEEEAARQLEALGLEIHIVDVDKKAVEEPTTAAALETQPAQAPLQTRLVLDCPERMHRLMAACMNASKLLPGVRRVPSLSAVREPLAETSQINFGMLSGRTDTERLAKMGQRAAIAATATQSDASMKENTAVSNTAEHGHDVGVKDSASKPRFTKTPDGRQLLLVSPAKGKPSKLEFALKSTASIPRVSQAQEAVPLPVAFSSGPGMDSIGDDFVMDSKELAVSRR